MLYHVIVMAISGGMCGWLVGGILWENAMRRVTLNILSGGIAGIGLRILASQITHDYGWYSFSCWGVGYSVYVIVLVLLTWPGGGDQWKRFRAKTSKALEALLDKVRQSTPQRKPRPVRA